MKLRQGGKAREVCLSLEEGQLRIMIATSQHLVTRPDKKGQKSHMSTLPLGRGGNSLFLVRSEVQDPNYTELNSFIAQKKDISF